MGNPKWNPSLSSAGRIAAGPEFVEDRSERAAEFDIRSVFGLIRRQAKLIIATVFIVCTVVALAVFQMTPIFSSTALIIVDPRQQSILDPEGQMALVPSDQGRVESEVEIVKSPSVFLTVVKNLELYKDPEFGPSAGWRDQLEAIVGIESPPPNAETVLKSTLEALQSATSISRVGITYLIAVTVRSTSPNRAAEIANALSNAYVAEQVDAKVAMVVGIQQALVGRLGEASATLRQAEAKLDDFIALNIDSIADDASRRDLVDLRNRIASRAAETIRLSRLVSESQSALVDRNWDNLVAQIDSESLTALNRRRAEIQQALAESANDERKAFDLRASLAKLDAEMEVEARSAIDRARGTLDSSQSAEQELRGLLRERIVQSELPKDTLVKLYEVQQEASVSRSVYQDLLNRSKVIESQKNVQVPDSRVVSQALPPSVPSFPKKKVILGAAAAISLMLGLGLAFLRENFIGGFVTEAQAEQVLHVPVISSLPRITSVGSPAAETVDHPLSPYSEAVRRARLDLELGSQLGVGSGSLRTVMVTSAMPGEGKTQTSISLARSLAIAGRKTLLIDCDLRRPNVHKALDIDLKGGLSDYLAGDGSVGSLSEILIKDNRTDLSIILGLKGARTSTDLLFESARFKTLLARAREVFDYIILDASPILPVVDPRLLLHHANAVLMVVRWAATSQREVGAAVADLERVNNRNIPILAVLNRAEVGAGGYGSSTRHYGNYGNYGHYGSED